MRSDQGAGYRFSKVSRRVWNDARFRALSHAPPNGQTLWLRLLTGPELTSIPGVILVWEAGLAQALRWSLDGFRDAMREVIVAGFAEADWESGLVWIPNAIRHNPPQSLNVVLGWKPAWDLVPECRLKLVAYQGLKAYVDGMSKGFRDAFVAGMRLPSTIQEQEQEQERERSPSFSSRDSISSQQIYSKTTAREDDSGVHHRSGVVNEMADGAFGGAVAAWADGIRSVTGKPFLAPRGATVEVTKLVDAIAAHCPDREARIDWARATGAAFARTNRGKLSAHSFVDWLNSPAEPQRVANGRPLQPDTQSWQAKKAINAKDGEKSK